MSTTTTTSFRGALGLTILYVVAAASGASILITEAIEGDGVFGILTGAAALLTFGALAVSSGRNARRLRRGAVDQVGSVAGDDAG